MAILLVSLSVFVFAYGYWVGIISHPGNYAFTRIGGKEMEPAIRKGDVVLVDRAYYDHDLNHVQRGDIVRVAPTTTMERSGHVILRVAGVGGDELSFGSKGDFRINGKGLEEFSSLAGIVYQATNVIESPRKLDANELFLIADNPEYAKDPRVGGIASVKNLRGKAVSLLFPPNRIGKIGGEN
jgi:signal peptidase I